MYKVAVTAAVPLLLLLLLCSATKSSEIDDLEVSERECERKFKDALLEISKEKTAAGKLKLFCPAAWELQMCINSIVFLHHDMRSYADKIFQDAKAPCSEIWFGNSN